MITLLIGENSFEVEQALAQLVTGFDGVAEKFDGTEMELRQLPDLLMGMSLFGEKRLVVIRGLSQNKAVWTALPEWLDRLSDDIHLVLIEAKPDKRTKTYKALQKAAEVQEFKPWTDRDERAAEQWVSKQATIRQVKIAPSAARLLVTRIGVDQWQLATTLDKLSVYNEITEEIIQDSTEARPHENIFALFEAALRGDADRISDMIRAVSLSEEPYQLFGLLAGQAIQLAALAVGRSGDDVAKDFGVHPFVLSKLRPYAERVGANGARSIVAVVAEADERIKTTSIDPWLAVEQTLLCIARAGK